MSNISDRLKKRTEKKGDAESLIHDGNIITSLKGEVAGLKKRSFEDFPVKDVEKKEIFASVFDLKDKTYFSILENMKKNGYDKTQPIILWLKDEKYYLIDGHRRYSCSVECGLEKIPAFVTEQFKNDNEVLDYMYSLQLDRRNLNDENLLKFALNEKWKDIPGRGSKRKKFADFFNISESMAQRVLKVAKDGGMDAIEQIIDPGHKASIHSVSEDIKAKEKSKKDGVDDLITEDGNTTVLETGDSKKNLTEDEEADRADKNFGKDSNSIDGANNKAIDAFSAFIRSAKKDEVDICKITITLAKKLKSAGAIENVDFLAIKGDIDKLKG